MVHYDTCPTPPGLLLYNFTVSHGPEIGRVPLSPFSGPNSAHRELVARNFFQWRSLIEKRCVNQYIYGHACHGR